MRGGTLNVPNIVGMAKAYELACEEREQANAKLFALSQKFIEELSSLQGITRNGMGDTALPSVVNLRLEGVENTAFLFNMDLNGVCISAGSACASASIKPSHVLTAMGLTEREAKESVRFSFGKNNTEEEIVLGAKLTAKFIKKLR